MSFSIDSFEQPRETHGVQYRLSLQSATCRVIGPRSIGWICKAGGRDIILVFACEMESRVVDTIVHYPNVWILTA